MKKQNKKNKVIKIGILPIILFIFAILTIINIANPEIHETIHTIQLRNKYATEGNVAMIGTTAYTTLEDAIEAATNGDEITIIAQDLQLTNAVQVDKNVIINLNNNTMYVPKIINTAELKLHSGTLSSNNTATSDNDLILNNGTLSIESIIITNIYGDGINNQSTLNLNKLNNTETKIIAKTPIKGEINSIRYNHAVSIYTDNNNSSLKIAEVVNVDTYTGEGKVLLNNIIYKDFYTAYNTIDSGETGEVEIKLLSDVTSSTIGNINISENQNIKINLNNYTLTLYSKQQIIDDGTEYIKYLNINKGTLTIENGAITDKNSDVHCFFILNKGVLNLSNVNFNNEVTKYEANLLNYAGKETNIKGKVTLKAIYSEGKLNIDGLLESNISNEYSVAGYTIIDGDEETIIKSGGVTGGINSDGILTIGTDDNTAENRPVITGYINNSETLTIGTGKSTVDNRPKIIGTISNSGECVINNVEMIYDTRAQIITNSNILTIKDGKFENNDVVGSAIQMSDYSWEFYIEKGEIKGKLHLGDVTRSGNRVLKIGVDDRVVDITNPIIKEIKTDSHDSGVLEEYCEWNLYDGVIEGGAISSSSSLRNTFKQAGDNEAYYSENYEFKAKEESDGNVVYRLVDKKNPELNGLKVLKDQSTYNTIKLEIWAKDTGIGLDKYVIKYRNKSEIQEKSTEKVWENAEDDKNYVVISDLDTGSTYEMSIILYDKEGNYYESGKIEGSTTSGINSVNLDKKEMTLVVGNTETLTATINPTNATNKSLEWMSSDSTVATVQDGVVTAVSAGTTTITVTTVDGRKTATCTVTVTEPTVPVTGVTLNKTTLTLEEEATETLTATIAPTNATNGDVTWKSNNTSVATVVNGQVTAVAPGTATITVTTVGKNAAGNSETATCTVTVTKKVVPNPTVPVTGVTLNKTTLTLEEEARETLTATVVPDNAHDKGVTWSSNNTSVATVVNGQVTAVAPGTATITVTTVGKNAEGNSETATCTVIVTKKATPTPDPEPDPEPEPEPDQNIDIQNISINKLEISLEEGDKETLVLTINPSNATIAEKIFTSSNTSVATIDENGIITAIEKGSTTITIVIKDKNGNVKTAECKVYVSKKAEPAEDDDKKDDNEKDPTISDVILPSTGFGKGILLTIIAVTIYGIIMLIKVKKMKQVK